MDVDKEWLDPLVILHKWGVRWSMERKDNGRGTGHSTLWSGLRPGQSADRGNPSLLLIGSIRRASDSSSLSFKMRVHTQSGTTRNPDGRIIGRPGEPET